MASDHSSTRIYDDAVIGHMRDIATTLDELSKQVAAADAAQPDAVVLERLLARRTVMLSGLFDTAFYLRNNSDVRKAGVDPLEHYVIFGDREGRQPNPLFSPHEYKWLNGDDVPHGQSLLHYIRKGERTGCRASLAFDAYTYLRANPELADFVDRPLFHFLRIGHAGNLVPCMRGEPPWDFSRGVDMKIAAVLSVKNDVALIDRQVSHLRAIGVDHIIACDLESTDGTLEALEKYRSGDFVILSLAAEATNGMAPPDATWEFEVMRQVKAATADWVIFLDADEFWLPASGWLKDCQGLLQADVLSVQRFNVPVTPDGPALPADLVPGRYGEVLLIADRIPDLREHLMENPDAPWIMGFDAPKTMARPGKIVGVTPGAHEAVSNDKHLRRIRPSDLLVAHLPMTTRERFFRKVDEIKALFAKQDLRAPGNTWRDNALAWHWRRWGVMTGEGELEEEYQRNVFSPERLQALRDNGTICSAAKLLSGVQLQFA